MTLGVCETWLNSSVPNGEVAIPSYDLYRRDHGSKGGSFSCMSQKDAEAREGWS